MKLPRRYLTFSLRTLFILMTAFALRLGVVVNRAQEQREAVEAIEAFGGSVCYDWQDVPLDAAHPFWLDGPLTPPGPVWLRRRVGDEFFQDAVGASFWAETDALKAIAYLKRLRKLKIITVTPFASNATMDKLKAALSNCEVKTIVF